MNSHRKKHARPGEPLPIDGTGSAAHHYCNVALASSKHLVGLVELQGEQLVAMAARLRELAEFLSSVRESQQPPHSTANRAASTAATCVHQENVQ